MAPVAERLSSHWGIIEPIQTEHSVDGQITELKTQLESVDASFPLHLIGYSWGAWLALLFAAKNPDLVQKVILVGSGPFEDTYVRDIEVTRKSRLTDDESTELQQLFSGIRGHGDTALARIGELTTQTDSFDVMKFESSAEPIAADMSIYESVWPEAARLRASGTLLREAQKVTCPVVAFHGDYDPHPADGVKAPLSSVLQNFRFVLLSQCGHTPWKEKQAYESFYRQLEGELE